jgi:hypothetical protein
MRKFIIATLALVFCLTSSQAGIIYVPANATDNAKTGTVPAEQFNQFDSKSLLTLTPAKVEQLTGKKMTIAEKLALKMVQKKLKKNAVAGKKAIDTKDKKQMLRLWIIFALVAIVLGILGLFIPFVWYLSYLAWLASLIFFILWIIALSA